MEGRRLKTAVKGKISLSFVYNDEGLRTEKTVGSGASAVTHYYYYSGDQLVAEEWNNNILLFLYDYDGTPVGMRYHKSTDNEDVWSVYWYETNLQGDVVAVYSSAGAKLATYTYDAWGKTSVSYTNSGASTGAYYNPLRYRGYYYDTETNLYYLQSRYYDPAICRFINADTVDVLGISQTLSDKNLYTYCDNNPIMRTDEDGEFWHIVVGAAVGGLIGGITKLVCNAIEGKDDIWDGVAMATVVGMASGALAATGVGLAGQIAGNAAISMIGNAAQQGIDNIQGDQSGFDFKSMFFDGVVGGISGAFGGAGASSGNSKTAVTLGKQLTKRIVHTGEIGKAFAYYGKNMMNGAGAHIYLELARGLGKSGLSNFVINGFKSARDRWFAL